MSKDAKSIAIGVFLALVAFRLFEMALRALDGAVQLPVLLLVVAVAVVAIFASTKGGRLKWRR